MMTMPRDHKRRFMSRRCPDPNCDGELVYEPPSRMLPAGAGTGVWRCNGLTHRTEDGPLVACAHIQEGAERRA